MERASRAAQQVRRAAAAQLEEEVSEVCRHPPGSHDEPAAAKRAQEAATLVDETPSFFVKATDKDEASVRPKFTNMKLSWDGVNALEWSNQFPDVLDGEVGPHPDTKSQILEETVAVVKLAPQERVQQLWSKLQTRLW